MKFLITTENRNKLTDMGLDDFFINHLTYDEYESILMGDITIDNFTSNLAKRLSFKDVKPVFEKLNLDYSEYETKSYEGIEIIREITKNISTN